MTSVLDLKRAIAEMEDFQDDAVRKNVIEILKGHTATLQQQLTDLKDKEKKEKEEAAAAAAAAAASTKKQPKKRFESSDEDDSDDSDDGKPAPPPPAAKKPAAAAKPAEPEHPSEFKAEEAARRTAREEREAAEKAAHAADLAAEKDEVAVAAALEAKQVAKKLASAVEAVKELQAFAEDAKSDRVRAILEAQAKEVTAEREELKEECAGLEEKVEKARDAARAKYHAAQEKKPAPAEKKAAPAAEPSDDDDEEEEVAPPPKKENPMIAMAKKRAAEQAARAKAEEEEAEAEEEEKRAAAEKAAKKKAKEEAAAAKAKAEEEEAEAEEAAAKAAAKAKEEAKKAKAAAKAKEEEEEEEAAAAKAAAEKKAKEAEEAEKKVERKDSQAGGALKKSESMRAAPGEMQVDGVGSGMIDELQDVLDDTKVQFGLVKIPMGSGTLARNKMIFVQWLGERCNAIKRMKHLQKVPEVAKLFGATHATYNISEKDDCTLEAACKELKGVFVTDSSGSFSTKALRAEMEARIKALGPASPARARKTAKEMGIGDDAVMTEMRKNLGRFNWCLWEPELPLKLFNAGSKSIDEMHSHLDESKVLFGLLRLGFGKGTFRRTKWVCITFVGQNVGAVSRGRQVQKRGEMEKELKPFSMSLEIQGKEEATIESILNRVKDFVVSDDLGGEEITVETFQEALAEEIQENAEFFGDEENEASFSDDFMQVIKKIHQDNSGVMWGCFSYA